MSIDTALAIAAFALAIHSGLFFVIILLLGDNTKAIESLNKTLTMLIGRQQ